MYGCSTVPGWLRPIRSWCVRGRRQDQRGLAPSPGAPVVDGCGGTLLPGLIDSHVHAMRVDNLARALAFGVTVKYPQTNITQHTHIGR